MTAHDYAAMSDAEANEAAARVMGWEFLRSGVDYAYFIMPDGGHRTIHNPPYKELSLHSMEFSPSTDLNHAAEFSSWFLSSRPDCRIEKIKHSDWAEVRVVRDVNDGPAIVGCEILTIASHKTESRAETLATLQAAQHGQR